MCKASEAQVNAIYRVTADKGVSTVLLVDQEGGVIDQVPVGLDGTIILLTKDGFEIVEFNRDAPKEESPWTPKERVYIPPYLDLTKVGNFTPAPPN